SVICMHPQPRRRASGSDERGVRPRNTPGTRRFPQGLILAAGGWRLRPVPHHSLLGVVIAVCDVLTVVVIVRLLRAVSTRRRRYDDTLRPVGRATPRRAVVLASPGAWDSAALSST